MWRASDRRCPGSSTCRSATSRLSRPRWDRLRRRSSLSRGLVKPQLLAHVREVAGYFTQQLSGLMHRYPDIVADIRGRGLLIGVKLHTSNREFMQHCRDAHLLVAGGGDNCVRLLPPLILSVEDASEAMGKLEQACEVARAKAKAAA